MPRKKKDPPREASVCAPLARRLGIVGWDALDPVLLAALALEAPVLLVGPHGTAKTALVERIAGALGAGEGFRHYNASLINYDDLVGIPLPDPSGGALRFVGTPAAVWEARFVLIDEISRCRADLQNKLFPLIHERRVAGLPLARLEHRWAAMNPPSPDVLDAGAAAATYIGSEPLDPALADRFPFVLRVPAWGDLTAEDRRAVIGGACEVPLEDGWLPELVAAARREMAACARALPPGLDDYVAQLLARLGAAHLPQSPRRARMLRRAITALVGAWRALGAAVDPEQCAWLALRSSLPQSASEVPPAEATLLAAHRHAWEVTRLAQDDAWRRLLEEPDLAARVALGDRLGVDDARLASLVTQALSGEADQARRIGLATAMFLAFRDRRALTPAAWEPLCRLAQRVLVPSESSVMIRPGSYAMSQWREMSRHTAARPENATPRQKLEANFCAALYPELLAGHNWGAVLARFEADCALFGLGTHLEHTP